MKGSAGIEGDAGGRCAPEIGDAIEDARQDAKAESTARERPARMTKRFLCMYFHDGIWWRQAIDAYDMEDARVRARRLSMQLLGEIVMVLPRQMGWLARMICRARNFLFR